MPTKFKVQIPLPTYGFSFHEYDRKINSFYFHFHLSPRLLVKECESAFFLSTQAQVETRIVGPLLVVW